MSTDKTLADVQPGGRVRLGDQAERAPWRSMDTCPRDGTVVRLRWGEDHVSPGWWSAPVSPVQNDDGTWPSDTGGFPWAFIDFNNGSAFVNHAVDTEYGPTHWAPYAALSAQPSPGGQGDARLLADVDERIATAKALGYEDDIGVGIGLLQCVRSALAARQPVGYSGVRTCGDERPCINCYSDQGDCLGPAPSQDPTHQTVLQEPVAWISRIRCVGPEYGKEIYGKLPVQSLNPLYYEHIPLYAAPAQAVDLGQFREAVEMAMEVPLNSVQRQSLQRLLALIDGQAVGNGN
ncbi:hypothetical protein B9Y88_15250 [Stenotrophomonas maltophilia]|uniref:hypothetical protein n=1 Tax=Stenotrophomonas muris TaxID=2963283 RepID=UPI000C26A242|nr:hypothetical protein B9Y88_15250 [Stenotrophomonas maltophilia]